MPIVSIGSDQKDLDLCRRYADESSAIYVYEIATYAYTSHLGVKLKVVGRILNLSLVVE